MRCTSLQTRSTVVQFSFSPFFSAWDVFPRRHSQPSPSKTRNEEFDHDSDFIGLDERIVCKLRLIVFYDCSDDGRHGRAH